MHMLTLQTVHQDDFTHCPRNGLDQLLRGHFVTIHQRHVRRIASLHIAFVPRFPRCGNQFLTQRNQCRRIFAAAQNDYPLPEIGNVVKADIKWWHCDRRYSATGHVNYIQRQSCIVSEGKQRYMETVCIKYIALYPMFCTPLQRKLRNALCNRCRRVNLNSSFGALESSADQGTLRV